MFYFIYILELKKFLTQSTRNNRCVKMGINVINLIILSYGEVYCYEPSKMNN